MRMDRLALILAAAGLMAHAAVQAQSQKTEPPMRASNAAGIAAFAMAARSGPGDKLEPRQRKAFDKYGSLGVVTLGMERPEIIVLCHTIARNFGDVAAQETDRDRRMAKFAEVWRLEQRLAEPQERAREALGESGYSRAMTKSGQSMNLLSMMPDPQVEQEVEAGEDLMFAWLSGLANRCGQMLDDMGVATVGGEPPAEYLQAKTRFRFRGADYSEVFAGTGLAPYAKDMCLGTTPPDFTGAPLDQRGANGMSLLDWAIECDDRASFDALVAAGFDLDANGLWEAPPLVSTASEKRIWYLRRLLDEDVSPDAMGRTETALMTANSDLDAINSGGDERAAFNLLRERGASLNFPDFDHSMWNRWSLHVSRWDLILEHWDEFESDPVELAQNLEFYLSGDMAWARKETEGAARQIKTLLIEDYGVCFPVGKTFQLETDERGFRIQPNCPAGD